MEMTMASFSRPWNPSTVLISTSASRARSALRCFQEAHLVQQGGAHSARRLETVSRETTTRTTLGSRLLP